MRPERRLTRIVRAGCALVILVALLCGVPVALCLFGHRPLPTSVPSIGDVRDIVGGQRVADATVIKVIALIGWIAWLQLVTSFLTETIAWLRGRPAPSIPLAGPVQLQVRRLLAAVALLVAAPAINVRPTLAAPLRSQPAMTMIQPTGQPPRVAGAPARAPTEIALPEYVVARRDTLWRLAEVHLGNPLRWRELFDLNRGRPQPDGRSLANPDLIIPGWQLRFPADATGVTTVPMATTPVPPPPPSSAPPRLPPAPVVGPHARPTPPVTPVPAPTPTTATAPPAATNGHHAPTNEASRSAQIVELVGGGLLAASLVTLLTRLRRAQQRRRRSGQSPHRPPPHLERVETTLRRHARTGRAEILNVALRAFAADVEWPPDTDASVLAVRCTDEQVEILLDTPPRHAPRGFVAAGDEHGWITAPDTTVDALARLADDTPAPLPSLVSIGTLEDADVLIDLETAGTLTVDGDDAAELINHLRAQLITSTWVDEVEILAVGAPGSDTPVATPRVRYFDDLDSAIDELAAMSGAITLGLDATGRTSTLTARVDAHGDPWIPTVLVCAQPIDGSTLERIQAITGNGGRGTAAVVACATRATSHAQLDDGMLTLQPLGLRVTPAILRADAATAIDELLTDATVDEIDASHRAVPVEAAPTTTDNLSEDHAAFEEPAFDIEVRVLGPVEIAGLTRQIERRRCAEMVTYLALHPEGVTDGRLKTVLWPDQVPLHSTFNTTVSTTRSRLGLAADGTHHFPHYVASGNKYRLGPRVTTDLARLERRYAHSARCPDDEAIMLLRDALELVRGQPFESVRGYEWAYTEALIASTEALIADAAHRLAQLLLSAGDAAGATWAAMQGLRGAPGGEMLYRDRMLACDLAGNPAGVESVMDELCQIVEAHEPYDELHPETVDLYSRLGHRDRLRTRRRRTESRESADGTRE
jgi:hypothetical protein